MFYLDQWAKQPTENQNGGKKCVVNETDIKWISNKNKIEFSYQRVFEK